MTETKTTKAGERTQEMECVFIISAEDRNVCYQCGRTRAEHEAEGAAADKIAHTPGPWKVTKSGNQNLWHILDEAGYPRAEVYAALSSTVARMNEAEANARLIAAAPDYDEAARCAVKSARDLPNGGIEITHEAFVALQYAISKSQGGAK